MIHLLWLWEKYIFFLLGLPPSFLVSEGVHYPHYSRCEENERLLAIHVDARISLIFRNPDIAASFHDIRGLIVKRQLLRTNKVTMISFRLV